MIIRAMDKSVENHATEYLFLAWRKSKLTRSDSDIGVGVS